ncbi:MAG: TIGR02217 family protein [Alphaproteobacteria bacterium]|nr:TIGR02217 family protein [Alphaproteobacteria bacterium]
MTAFHEVRFPDDIAYGSLGGPEYSTDVIITAGGFEQRNINWQDARSVYNVAHGVKTQSQLDALLAFFRARKGRAYGFRFKDWADYSANMQQIGVGTGALTTFQLVKTYSSGGITEIRNIRKPVDNSVSIYVDNMLQNSGFSVNYETGLVTFASAPANTKIIKASFEFDVPVRFDTDRLSSSLDSYGVHSWKNIPLVEVRI